MTDEQKSTTPQGADETVEGAVVVAEVVDEGGVEAEAMIATDFTHAVIVAAFADQAAAIETYDALKQAEITQGLHIDAVAVVRSDAAGNIHAQKLTDHSTRKGVAWGAAAGVVLGIIFPPSILASAVGVGILGGAVGKIRNIHHYNQLEEDLAGSLPPDSSGIVALVELAQVEAVKETMPKATQITEKPVEEKTAAAIEEAGKSTDTADASASPAS